MPLLPLAPFRKISLHHLQCFAAVARLQEQVAAAAECGITPGRMTHILDQLSEAFGTQLVKDGELTGAGERTIVFVRQILSLATRAERAVNPNMLHIGFTRSFTGAMKDVFGQLSKNFESKPVTITMSSASSDQIIRQVVEGEVDIGVVISEAVENYPTKGIYPVLNGTKEEKGGSVFKLPGFMFAREDHPLHSRNKVTAKNLSEGQFAWFDPRLSPALHGEIEVNIRENGGPKQFRVSHVVSELETIYSTLISQDVVTFMPAPFENYRFAGVKRVKHSWQLPAWEFRIIRYQHNKDALVKLAFLELERICHAMQEEWLDKEEAGLGLRPRRLSATGAE